jgi:threonine dehydrogenase-like Zn-dependent dehydrogenase
MASSPTASRRSSIRAAAPTARAPASCATSAPRSSRRRRRRWAISREAIGAIDVVYEATGVSTLAFDALATLGTNGIFIFTGVPGRARPPAPIDTDPDADIGAAEIRSCSAR